MQDQDSKDTNVKATVDAVTGLVKAIPIYQDTLQPAAKQIGSSLETVTKTINIALAPIKALVWGYEKIEAFVNERVSEKLKNVPEENITTPKPEIAGPAVEALRYAGYDENLRELYANLLANAMDIKTIREAHPGFVEILKNISSDEASLLQAFILKQSYPLLDIRGKTEGRNDGYVIYLSNFSHLHKITTTQQPDLIPSYLDNLCRLGILEIPAMTRITVENAYAELKDDPELQIIEKQLLGVNRKMELGEKMVKLTNFGKLFVRNVVKDKE